MTRLAVIAMALALTLAWACPAAGAAEFSDEATALPFPPDARELEFKESFHDISYSSGSPLKSLAAFYLKEMPARGWELDEKSAKIDKDSIELTFRHERAKVQLKLDQRSKEVRVSMDCKGLAFSNANDPAKLAAAGIPVSRAALFLQKELPLPEGASALQYSGEGCMLKSPLSLQEAFDHFTRAVQGKGFRESRRPIKTDTRRYTEFTKGSVEVSVNVFSDPVGSRIVLEHKDKVKEPAKPPLAAVASLPIKNARGGDEPAANDSPATPVDNTPIDVTSNKGSVKISYAGRQYTFSNVACFQTKRQGSRPMLVFSAKSIPVNKLQSMIATKEDFSFGDLYEGSMPEHLIVQVGDSPSFTFALQNVYVANSVDDPVNEMKVDGGRVQGSLKMPPKQIFEGEQFSFAATADAVIITPSTRIKGPADRAERSDLPGLGEAPVPFPAKTENVVQEGSKFRKTYKTKVAMPLADVAAFYRQELKGKGWVQAEAGADDAPLHLKTNALEASLTLTQQGETTEIEVVARDTALARREGVLPEPGKGRLVLANAHSVAVVYTIGKSNYSLKPGQGGEDMTKALNYSIAPGTYKVVIKIPGQAEQTEQIELTAGATWAVITLPTGTCLPMQLY